MKLKNFVQNYLGIFLKAHDSNPPGYAVYIVVGDNSIDSKNYMCPDKEFFFKYPEGSSEEMLKALMTTFSKQTLSLYEIVIHSFSENSITFSEMQAAYIVPEDQCIVCNRFKTFEEVEEFLRR